MQIRQIYYYALICKDRQTSNIHKLSVTVTDDSLYNFTIVLEAQLLHDTSPPAVNCGLE